MKSPLASARSTLLSVAIVTVLLVWALRDIAVLVGFAVLLAYALRPAVLMIERMRDQRGRTLPRGIVAGGLMLALVVIVGWLLALAVPRIGAEAGHFVTNAPEIMARIVQDLRVYAAERGLSSWLDPAIESVRADLAGMVENLGGVLASGAARMFGGIGNLLGLTLVPLLAFYLLAESDAVRVSALRFVPEEAGVELSRLGGVVDRALRSYVRGQAIVCLMTGALVGAALAVLQHPMALLLGFVVAVAELIPYLGFMVAAAAIALAGFSVSPYQALLGLAVYIGLNWAIGTLITPRVIGRYLRMHPFIVTVSVLAGAQLMGPAGALLALPAAAVIQAVIGELAPEPKLAARRAPVIPPVGGS
ncbi:MAG: AI-2E family transporter [Candidatus Eisenbacteria bacterium]